MNVIKEDEQEIQQRYDNLPDYHLRNPLKRIEDLIETNHWVPVKNDLRLDKSLKMIKQKTRKLKKGDHYELWIDDFSFRKRFESRGLINNLNDVLRRLELDKNFSNICDIKGMMNSINDYAERANLALYSNMMSFQLYVIIINALSSRRPLPEEIKELDCGGYVVMTTEVGKTVILTPSLLVLRDIRCPFAKIYLSDWVRCASDVHTEKFLLHFGATVGNRVNPLHYPTYHVIDELIRWGNDVLVHYGNPGFKLLKTYEALIMGFLMASSDDKVITKDLFWKNTIRDLLIEDASYVRPLERLKEIFGSFRSIHWFSQLYGLHRIWGHPLVNSDKGMEKVIMIGKKNIVLSDKMPKIVGRHFIVMLFKSFLSKYNRYPAARIIDNDSIEDMYKRNDSGLLHAIEQDLSLADCVSLEQNFQLPETFNLSMIVADKSVSPTKSELISNIKARKTVMNSDLRRGVLRWLNDTATDPRELLKAIDEGKFPDDHKIIGLTPKERELNPTPRMFALMSHLMRVYVVVTESMLSEHILPLFPQITMTDSLLELNHKIIASGRLQKNNSRVMKRRGQKTICMSLDFEKWNGHMRKKSTRFVFEGLGKLFGLPNLYNATYDIFESSYIYLADGSYCPTIRNNQLCIEEPKSFTGHQGGMEGLRQKGWTLFTIVCLDMICKRHNCTFKSMGMGDNQILLLTFYTYNVTVVGDPTPAGDQEMRDKYEALFRDLMDVFGELGLPLKPLETWASESLFLYGKFPAWKGVPLSMDLKRIMRIFPFSNIGIMTTENMLNTVSGAAAAATQAAPCVFVSYLAGLLMLSSTIRQLLVYHPMTGEGLSSILSKITRCRTVKRLRSPIWSLKTSNGNLIEYPVNTPVDVGNLTILLMCIPRCMGGYVTFNLPSIIIRGFPDPLSRDLYVMQSFANSTHEDLMRLYILNWSKIILMPDINFKMLMEDILSVNHLNPMTPMSHVRQSVTRYLAQAGRIKNTEFLDLMRSANGEYREHLANILCSGGKIHIRLMQDIYKSTITGYVDSIISKVTKTSTIQKLSVSNAKKDISEAIEMTEENYFLFFIWRSNAEGVDWDSDCSTSYARKIRELGWQRKLKDITVPFPLSYMEKAECYSKTNLGCSCGDGYVSIHVSDSNCDQTHWDTTLGNGLPYLGSMTKEKVVIQSGAQLYSSEPLVKRPVKLLRTINWFVPESSEAARLIEACVSAVTDLDKNQFKGVHEGTSGAESHRYHDSSLSHGTLTSSNYLYSTKYHMSTDNFIRYAKGGENYDVHFQSLLCLISESTNYDVFSYERRTSKLQRSYHWRQCCYECVTPTDETFTDVGSKGGVVFIPYYKQNRYLYVKEDNISYIWKTRPYESMISCTLGLDRYETMRPDTKYEWLLDVFADTIVSMILSPSETVSDGKTMNFQRGDIFNRVAYLKIEPEHLFIKVIKNIHVVAASLISSTDYSYPTWDKIVEKSKTLISSAPLDSMIGLSVMFSWIETKQRLEDCLGLKTDDDPPSLTGAGEAARRKLYEMVKTGYQSKYYRNRTVFILEELKDQGLTYKLIAIALLVEHRDKCEDCLIRLLSTHVSSFAADIMTIVCRSGHIVFERYLIKSVKTNVSLDRLRKDCPSRLGVCITARHRDTKKLVKLPYSNLIIISQTSLLRPVYIRWSNEDIRRFEESCLSYEVKKSIIRVSDIIKCMTKPTSSLYKYSELFSTYTREWGPDSQVVLLGDGSGSTSNLLHKMTHCKKIIVSTLIDSETVIPQTLPHLFAISRESDPIDKFRMINKVNNILHHRWIADWKATAEESNYLVSDIELIGIERKEDRQLAMKKILSLTAWKCIIVKDYIYTVGELLERMSLVIDVSKKVELVTSQHRQRNLPEVWWIMKEIHGIKQPLLENHAICYHKNIVREIWNRLLFSLYEEHDAHGTLTLQIDKLMMSSQSYNDMISRAELFLSYGNVGSMLPLRDFTRILGRLQTYKKPASADYSREDRKLRMYQSDDGRLRENLLILGISMLANVKDRINLINDSRYWKLRWSSKQSSENWIPYLIRMSTPVVEYQINTDYVGILSRYMKTKNLLFKTIGKNKIIKFDYQIKRETLCFPVAKNMIIRLPKVKGKSNQRK